MAKVSNWDKFVLLLWKNAVLQLAHKTQFIIELLIPPLFMLLVVMIRCTFTPAVSPIAEYQPYDIDNLKGFKANYDAAHTMRKFLSKILSKSSDSQSMQIQAESKYPLFAIYYAPKTDALDTLVGAAAQMLDIQYNGYENVNALADAVKASNAFVGVEFEGDWSDPDNMPDQLQFSLRFPFELRTVSVFQNLWYTGRLFDTYTKGGPREPEINTGGNPSYINEEFLPVQHALSKTFIQLKSKVDDLPDIQMQRYPFPSYVDDQFLQHVGEMMAMLIMFSFIYPSLCIARYITMEKEKQLKEVMKIMGLSNWLHWTAWFVKNFIMLTISAILIVILLKIPWTNNLAVFQHSEFTVVLLFFIVYIISAITFCFMVAPFFSKASTAAAVMGLLWFLTYLPATGRGYDSMSLGTKLGWSLLANSAMTFGCKLLMQYEMSGEGLKWSNLFTESSADDSLSMGLLLIMMLVSSVIYMIICLYVEQVFPSKFGMPRKWYFPFTRSFWCGSRDYGGVEDINAYREQTDKRSNTFEVEPDDKHVGLQLKNLHRKFGNHVAVKGITMNMFEDEITVLLGHNGAGKTTTISMITGMLKPTAGTAIINGSDIRTNLEGARMSLGICPQHNVLFDDMSVANHLRFFSRLKGLRGADVKREVDKYLKLIELQDKANVLSAKLSGGMKRKLSICCALCGDTKVVLCDEPSSGMDPAARRQLWDLLQKEKVGRTLLLTTHFMDEADVLGDRIGIMCDGDLRCYGTSFFLKKHYGSGYTLICVKEADCVVEDVTALLALYIPGIEPKSDIGTELTYELPDQYSGRFEKMLGALEDRSKELHLSGYGVGITTMEEVFMKVGAETHAAVQSDGTQGRLESGGGAGGIGRAGKEEKKKETINDAANDDDTESMPSHTEFSQRRRSLRGLKLTKNQYHAMFLKKMLFTLRNKLLFALQIIMPIVFVVLSYVMYKSAEGKRGAPPMTVEVNQYPDTVVLLDRGANLKGLSNGVADQYEKIAKSYGERHLYETVHNFTAHILDLHDVQSRVNSRYVAAASVISNDLIIAWQNAFPLHTAPLSANLVHKAIARATINENADIIVTNAPYPEVPSPDMSVINLIFSFGSQLGGNLSFCMCFLSSFYLFSLIKERASRAKLLQFVSGVRVFTFWITQFVWDFVTFTFTFIVIMITIICFQEEPFTTFTQLGRYFLVLLVFGFSALPYTYLLSLFFNAPAIGFAVTTIINVFVGVALYVVVKVMEEDIFKIKGTAAAIKHVCRIFPHYTLQEGLFKSFVLATKETTCDAIDLPPILRCELMPTCCKIPSFFDMEELLVDIIYMLVSGVVFFLIVIVLEYNLFNELLYLIRKRTIKPPPPPEDGYFNDDVEKERQRILNMSSDQISAKNLVLDRMTKFYSSFLAVNQVSLCVEEAECFGLLGVNGAGKTTTFKMLTGDERISFGSAYVQGLSLESDMNRIYERIGYCPQFDALLEDLTGREVLRIFCLLRGIHSHNTKRISEELAKALGFIKHIDKRTSAYSGGNKRKLSTAIALIGRPSVVYLDEPTTGMDPAARRQLWNVICSVRDSGKSIVLTSHSMEECEALCTRLAIMVNGEFKCIGSTQHLKNKYSKGLVVKIKVHRGREAMRVSQISRGSRYRTQGSDSDSVPSTPVAYANTSALSLRKSNGSLNDSHSDSTAEASTIGTVASFNKQQIDDRDDEAVGAGNINDVKEFVQSKFPTAILQEEHQGMLTYYIPLSDIKWSKIFGMMERNRKELNIEDYSISQTTLEEIFLDFAKFQREDPRKIKRRRRRKGTGIKRQAAEATAIA
ncbi:phospholipid-transporting ATPase ABCA3 isoform X1 [Drosophila nasuta]|uniref:phospholipid-transporting ATPase ABCA3 isoform X1 n=1 Tax=Drosophila nasuta TaxID=42062 RepID=UPI00295EE915|nr:phospholipid-transporting ATPase ABCA3 isoform X1 [Drosophila nasuta]XP_060661354.1 phospholipid-transporting ATPase ABCA3 isoform X1 [Drosophila nasuta]XP_060661355.1 phospholipid-transporting ATPase ABCA3 isoform X1 [Drosophila nasuta]